MAPDDRPALEALEARVTALEARLDDEPDAASAGGTFWALEALRERSAGWDGGGVLFAGSVEAVPGERVEWQISHPTAAVADGDWGELAETLGALGSPVRLRLLQAVATGTRTSAELQALPGIGTAGQVYHHLRTLTASGWLRASGRGSWAVPPERLVPLLVTLAAARR